MPASRILPLARTSRWAIAGSSTRNARAISAVLSPPSSRRVSATCAGGASDGWQQVKISRSRSSRTGPSSASPGCCASADSAAWAWRSAREDSRRRRSIARRRAVVMIQPAGLGGTPSAGQRAEATANASWTASSATSMSPKTRTRTATARPYSSRKTRSTSVTPVRRGAEARSRLVRERPHLDWQRRRRRRPAPPCDGGVEVGRADDREAAQVLLALGERAVGHQDVAALDPQHRGRRRRVQPAGEDPGPGGAHLLVERGDVAADRLHVDVLGRRAVGLVDAEQVLLHLVPPWGGECPHPLYE